MNDPEYEKTIMHQFVSFCREAIRRGAGNAFRVAENRRKHQILLDDLDEPVSELVSADEYPSTYEVYHVMDQKIAIHNEKLADAMNRLPATRREILLMAFFLEMTDNEISLVLQIPRRTVNYQRNVALQQLNQIMTEI